MKFAHHGPEPQIVEKIRGHIHIQMNVFDPPIPHPYQLIADRVGFLARPKAIVCARESPHRNW
jgi:hypothetical protein